MILKGVNAMLLRNIDDIKKVLSPYQSCLFLRSEENCTLKSIIFLYYFTVENK